MQSGLYVIFEGSDGSGKSSTMRGVAEAFADRLQIKQTHHPGSTPLGAHIRKLVKFPQEIDPSIHIDGLSRQMLYMVDTISFIRTVLEPTLETGQSVFADRSSFISSIVYSVADGLDLQDVHRLFQLIVPPKADRLYVMRCPWEVGRERVRANRTEGYDGGKAGELDHYDKKPGSFFKKVQETYDNLLTGPAEQTILVSRSVALDDVIYIDATQPPQKVVQDIVEDLDRVLAARFNV